METSPGARRPTRPPAVQSQSRMLTMEEAMKQSTMRFAAGEIVKGTIIERLEDKDGMVVLSKEKAEFKQNWDKILTICNEGGTISGKVKAIVKGGLLVNIGVEAFLPASQIDIVPPRNLTPFVGNSYEF